ncbi:hypothetical protein GCM10010233_16870 [Streptomyces pseudogriseolus]|nr:hypothetical protein GCM10010233_16870 [Streptomyces gancidicus]
MPGWLATVVEWNPISHTASAVRDRLAPRRRTGPRLGRGPLAPALLAVFFPLAVRRFARLSR